MSSLIIALLFLVLIALVCFWLVHLHGKEKERRQKTLVQQLAQLGTAHQLSFTSQELLREAAIGMDCLRGKAIVLNKSGHTGMESTLIDLREMRACRVHKKYGTVPVGDTSGLRPHLETILLRFEREGHPPVELPFYRFSVNHIFEIPELETKARQWEALFSKLQRK